jgi:hypothetical protein
MLFGVSLKVISFLGQAIVQSPHPLQRDSLISIFGIFHFPWGYYSWKAMILFETN